MREVYLLAMGIHFRAGAYDIFHNGGMGVGGNGTDICISKFSPNEIH